MEYQGIRAIKSAYANQVYDNGSVERALEIQRKDYKEPTFDGYEIHPEHVPNLQELQDATNDISIDLLALDQEFQGCAQKYGDLMDDVGMRLNAIQEDLDSEQDRIEDLNTICGNYQDFASVKTLNYKYFSGSFSHDGNYVFYCPVSGDQTNLSIIDVTGNGYEGNRYVYDRTDGYQQEAVDTSRRAYATDKDNYKTAYEYSRITADKKMPSYPSNVNFDSEEAYCTLTLASEDPIGCVKVTSDLDSLTLTDLKYSQNGGGTYLSALDHEVDIISKEAIYKDGGNYAYGSGIICFPSTDHIRMSFRSKGVQQDELLAYDIADTTTSEDGTPITKTIELPYAKRHIVRLNDIHTVSSEFEGVALMQSGQLIEDPVDSIAIFANEYVPQSYSDKKHFEYILTVNGVDYDITPINSNRRGTKVIRYSEDIADDYYEVHTNESIKSVYLKVLMYADSTQSTPVLANLKVCYGKVVEK